MIGLHSVRRSACSLRHIAIAGAIAGAVAGVLGAGCGESAAPSAGAASGSAAGSATGTAASSSGAAAEIPPLPGVPPGLREWFWTDVLAAPLPGETPPDRALLAIESPSARMDALSDLAPEHDPRALTTLLAALGDKQVGVACAAAHDLGAYGYAAAIPRLLKGLGPWPIEYDVPLALRAAEATALARLGNPAGVPLVLMILAEGTSLQTPDIELPWTRTPQMAFAQELVLPGLVALAGQDFGFRSAAPVAEREASVLAARAWWDERRLALWAAAPLSDAGQIARVRMLVAHLGAYQLRQVDGARFTLAQHGPAVLPYLVEGLASPDDYVRLHSLEVLEKLVDMADGKLRVRLASLAARPLLEDPSGGVAAQAARVAGATGVADQLIVAARRRREPDVLLAIIDALGVSGRPEARDELLAMQRTPPAGAALPDLAVALEAALLQCDCQRAPDAFLAFLASPDAEVAYAALQRLLALTGSDAGLDPSAPPAAREEALARARTALDERCP